MSLTMLYKVCILYTIMHYRDFYNSDEAQRRAAEQFLVALRVGCALLLLTYLLFG